MVLLKVMRTAPLAGVMVPNWLTKTPLVGVPMRPRKPTSGVFGAEALENWTARI